ncbi:hypothetical protein BDK51DRAFT_29060 [Blyttiomyces helicus]|uniref:Uncharacterized protein n=1 Tax=Blyttiomyces helicus TaxID=388810 RepID=A0A4P9WS57_9FUNG|nr:hypothetical protein BDK51DRAFT_29060 [Blyttiomyces helicus]|eukprot:RKO94130.1 hypothetical protein BDK51DRAFT_29060 [Blyttiomyces helicus]
MADLYPEYGWSDALGRSGPLAKKRRVDCDLPSLRKRQPISATEEFPIIQDLDISVLTAYEPSRIDFAYYACLCFSRMRHIVAYRLLTPKRQMNRDTGGGGVGEEGVEGRFVLPARANGVPAAPLPVPTVSGARRAPKASAVLACGSGGYREARSKCPKDPSRKSLMGPWPLYVLGRPADGRRDLKKKIREDLALLEKWRFVGRRANVGRKEIEYAMSGKYRYRTSQICFQARVKGILDKWF